MASFLKQIHGSSTFDFEDFARVLLDLVLPEFLQIRREKFEFWEKSFGNLVPHDEMTLWLNFHVIWWAKTQDWVLD